MPKLKLIFLIFFLISIINCSNKFSKKRERGAGILMHITSLPSNYGVGTLGKEAFKFVDFLAKSKQKY